MSPQARRVLAALQRTGRRGITQIDFDIPTCDGGEPIKRVAARIGELESARYTIERVGRRNKCVIYALSSVASGARAAAADGRPEQGPALLTGGSDALVLDITAEEPKPAPQLAIYDWEDEAA